MAKHTTTSTTPGSTTPGSTTAPGQAQTSTGHGSAPATDQQLSTATDQQQAPPAAGSAGQAPPRKYSLADIQHQKKRNKYSYQTAAGRARINTMLHPTLKKALQQLADAHGQTVPDVLEGILCDYLNIDLPSPRQK